MKQLNHFWEIVVQGKVSFIIFSKYLCCFFLNLNINYVVWCVTWQPGDFPCGFGKMLRIQ